MCGRPPCVAPGAAPEARGGRISIRFTSVMSSASIFSPVCLARQAAHESVIFFRSRNSGVRRRRYAAPTSSGNRSVGAPGRKTNRAIMTPWNPAIPEQPFRTRFTPRMPGWQGRSRSARIAGAHRQPASANDVGYGASDVTARCQGEPS